MSINLTDELLAKTKKGKIASAKQIFLEGGQENLQQIGENTHQLENAIKDISVSGGASTANAVSFDNAASGMTAVNAQAAIDELAAKNKQQDATIDTKANKDDVNSELAKKFDNKNIAHELGDSEKLVLSQKIGKYCYLDNNFQIKQILDNKVEYEINDYVDINKKYNFIFPFKKGKVYTISNIGNAAVYPLSALDLNGTKIEIIEQNFSLNKTIKYTPSEDGALLSALVSDKSTGNNIRIKIEFDGSDTISTLPAIGNEVAKISKNLDEVNEKVIEYTKKKPVVVFCFDENIEDNRHVILKKYKLTATFAHSKDINLMKTLIKEGFDICPYMGDRYKVDISPAKTLSERVEKVKEDIVNVMKLLHSVHIYKPTMLLCPYHQYSNATKIALEELNYTFRYIRATQINSFDENGLGSIDYSPYNTLDGTDLYQIPLLMDNYDTVDKIINAIDSNIESNKRGLIMPMMHAFSSAGGLTTISEEDFEKIVEHVSNLQKEGKIYIMNIRSYFKYWNEVLANEDLYSEILLSFNDIQ